MIRPSFKAALVGWDAVRKIWMEAFTRNSEISVTMEGPVVSVTNNVGWVVGIEKARVRRASGEGFDSADLTTRTFEKPDGRWLVVHTHESRIAE